MASSESFVNRAYVNVGDSMLLSSLTHHSETKIWLISAEEFVIESTGIRPFGGLAESHPLTLMLEYEQEAKDVLLFSFPLKAEGQYLSPTFHPHYLHSSTSCIDESFFLKKHHEMMSDEHG